MPRHKYKSTPQEKRSYFEMQEGLDIYDPNTEEMMMECFCGDKNTDAQIWIQYPREVDKEFCPACGKRLNS